MKKTAYFCMEFAIDQALKTYAGGLGFLAGSHFRAAKRLNQPLVGVSILWSYGYYDQVRDVNGDMEVKYIRKYYEFLEDLNFKFSIKINNRDVWVKVYKLEEDVFNTCPIYFLTTDIPENDDFGREISYRLYDANNLLHVAQEILLGKGGYIAIKELEKDVELFHMNEPHSLPLVFKMLSEYNLSYVKEHVVFTTHTPLPEGNEVQDLNFLNSMNFFEDVSLEVAKKLGGEPFNYTACALRVSKKANAVSKRHREVCEEMWRGLKDRCEIIAITNAQDRHYWQDSIIKEAAEKYDIDLLRERKLELKEILFEEVADQTGKIFKKNRLTVVWARRFVPYKRPYILLYDERKLRELIKKKKIQVIWAGKPHPADSKMIATFNYIVSKTRSLKGAAILTGYELKLSKMLKQGSDIWLNTPKLKHEASGTSGMTASMNASIHMSTLDGWHVEWAKMYPDDSFTIGDGVRDDDEYVANCIYSLLSDVSDLYDTEAWWIKACNCVNHIVEYFDAERMAKEYAEKLYK
ncbi:alpha-glucan family phosphorylase [Methanocaldococcus infernus]